MIAALTPYTVVTTLNNLYNQIGLSCNTKWGITMTNYTQTIMHAKEISTGHTITDHNS